MQGKFAYFAVQFEFLNQLFNHIMKTISKLICVMLCVFATTPAFAQFNLKKAVGGAAKAVQAATLTDEQMTAYVKEYIDWMDTHNKVCEPDHPYTQRLNRLTEGLTDVEGIPLNFKVYWVVDVNAFACADGSVRVFAALMDIMSDEELLGVIGHEIGHVAHKDSKKAFRTALLTSALKDGISANGGTIAALTDSQIGDLGGASAMAISFKRLKEIQGEGKQSKINQLFSSHPDLDKRIQRMEKRATDEGITPPEVKAEEKK